MNLRIPLQIIDGRLVLTAVIESKYVRGNRSILTFVLDTGNPDSYLSYKDVLELQISVNNRPIDGKVDFGGSTFNKISLPKMKLHLLNEDKAKGIHTLQVSLCALKTTKTSEKRMHAAQALPSILGLDFLREQRASLHVIIMEDLAYLEFENEPVLNSRTKKELDLARKLPLNEYKELT